MEIKNANFGSIDSQGGPISIGDTKITYVIEGLSELLTEFKEQLRIIETLINQFKAKTALVLLLELEERVADIKHPDKNKILGKISYLKAVCKREFPESKIEDAAKDFIKAYQLNSSDTSFRDRASVEYLNLGETQKSISFAQEILKVEEYNTSAWYIMAVTADDLKSFVLTIPKTVLNEYNFKLSLIHHILMTGNLNFFEDLSHYHLTLNIDFSKYKLVSFNNLEAWRQAIDLAVNLFFNDYPKKYVSGEKFCFQESETARSVLKLLTDYVEKLEDSEIKDSIYYQQFFFYYFSYLITNNIIYLDSIKRIFSKIDKDFWFFTFCFCQILNHNNEHELSLVQILEYEASGGQMSSESYLFKSAILVLTGRTEEVLSSFSDYLNSISVIDQRNGLNIVEGFLNTLSKKVGNDNIALHLEKIRKKNFVDNHLKALLEITVTTRYDENSDKEQIYKELIKITDYPHFDITWKKLIAENYNAVGRRKEAINYLKTFVDKKNINETLHFYIILLYEQLCDKNDQEKGYYEELLELLKFWRLHSEYPDAKLLTWEHNLYSEINNLEEIEKVDAYLYENFPTNEQYILLYLNTLERTGNYTKIKEVADKIGSKIENEAFGVAISVILMRSQADVEKGFQILYNLASDLNNTIARTNYFASSMVLKEQKFFISYDEVKMGTWVIYMVGDKKEHRKIDRNSGFQKELLGRKPGDTFTAVTNLSGKLTTIQILEILNDAWHLLRTIQEEATNPVNELGFETLQLPSSAEDFSAFLKSQFGPIGQKEKEFKEKSLDDYYNYRVGFSEISKMVFRENYIDAYFFLTGSIGSKFTTIPSLLTKDAAVHPSGEVIKYALDFTSLLLFYTLEKEAGFDFKHKFTVSYLLKDEINREIIELNNSPSSSMTLQITTQYIRKYDTSENYNRNRIDFLHSLLNWIEKHCIIDLVAEKLNLVTKFRENERPDGMMRILIDHLCISDRDNSLLISSDTTLFLFTRRSNTIGNIINPEKYLTFYYPEKCDTEFYRFLLKSSYIGINISLDTLKNEFFQYISGGTNYYSTCLENLSYTVHGNPKIIGMLSRFLKDLYVMPVLTLEQKNIYAHGMLSRALYGMPREVVIAFSGQLWVDFKLMGNLYNQVISVVKNILE